MGFREVRKRDGTIVPFDASRIVAVITKATRAEGEGSDKEAEKVSEGVVKGLGKLYPSDHLLNIEEIQDAVERQLIIQDYPKTAKGYILYREERARLREARRTIPEYVHKLAQESKKYFRNPLGEFVYYRSYSRWIESEGRRETWIETVDRYVAYMRARLGKKLRDDEYAEVREAILKQEAMPSMRLLWSAGPGVDASNVTAYNCSFVAPSSIKRS